VHIDDAAYEADENWLHLAPGRQKRIALRPIRADARTPEGEIRALNADRIIRYMGRA
jgi:beta-mannosidase